MGKPDTSAKIAGEIALHLIDGRPQVCYRMREGAEWKVRAEAPNNPALGSRQTTDTAPEGA